jgi:hypothetical protein
MREGDPHGRRTGNPFVSPFIDAAAGMRQGGARAQDARE